MTRHQSALSTLIGEVLTDPDLAHSDVFRRMQNEYPTGVKIPNQQMRDLEDSGTLAHHHWHGEWNHTLNPTRTSLNKRRALTEL